MRLSVQAVREPENAEKNEKQKRHTKRYSSRVCGGTPEQPIVMIFGNVRDLADVINRAKFYIVRSNVFPPSMGQISGLP